MRATRLLFTLLTLIGVTSPVSAQARRPPLTLATAAFPDGRAIPVRFSQAAEGAAPGEGTSPGLTWTNVPEGTRSFFLHMHDMEVARGGTTTDQVHWLVWNLPASANGLPEGVPRGSRLADGSYQISATGPVYRGPGAPANGPPHHYVFELYALDTTLTVEPSDDAFETRERVLTAIQGHVIGKAVYLGLFRRPE
ncbi:MAG: YbhB/YbcL family Raf kinase inhibitor-like protein [Gemmatimonadales bacterium]|nr:MAG: YbhB/YbcL family Raf kinase inhibitor-like protein [Gemmatimonadales bacterium]